MSDDACGPAPSERDRREGGPFLGKHPFGMSGALMVVVEQHLDVLFETACIGFLKAFFVERNALLVAPDGAGQLPG
jgi:hypothetical protein